MKIVLTTHQFLPEFSSGTEIITLGIARELHRRGHEVVLFTGSPTTQPLVDDQRFDEYTFEGMRIIRFRHELVPMNGQNDIMELEFNSSLFHRFFHHFLSEYKPDVVHFIHLQRLTASAINAAHELHIPCFFTATDFWLVCPINLLRLADGSMCAGPRNAGANCAKHLVQMTQTRPVVEEVESKPEGHIAWEIEGARDGWLKSSDYTRYILSISARTPFLRNQAQKLQKLFVPSRFMEHVLASNGIPQDRFALLPYGIDVDRITRNVDRGRFENLRIAFTGTISEHKGVHVLVKAFRQLPPQLPVQLYIYGKLTDFPTYVAELRTLIGDDSRIHLCGPYDHDRINDVLALTDVLVCPSMWYENTPLVIYEAQAAGVPVIASDSQGMSEIVTPNVNGLLFPLGDHSALASILQTLHEDRSLVRRLAEGTVIPLSISQHVDALEGFYGVPEITELSADPTPDFLPDSIVAANPGHST